MTWRYDIGFSREQRHKMLNATIEFGYTSPIIIEGDARFVVSLPYWLEGHASLAVGISHIAIVCDRDPNIHEVIGEERCRPALT